MIGTALVQFQLTDPDLARRETAVASIARSPEADQLAPLQASIAGETDPALKARKTQLANFLSARFADAPADRIAAIDSLSADTSVEARSVLNQILTVRSGVAATAPEGNIARILDPTQTPDASYATLVEAELAPAADIAGHDPRDADRQHLDGRVGGVPLAQLNSDAGRERAYAAACRPPDWRRPSSPMQTAMRR